MCSLSAQESIRFLADYLDLSFGGMSISFRSNQLTKSITFEKGITFCKLFCLHLFQFW